MGMAWHYNCTILTVFAIDLSTVIFQFTVSASMIGISSDNPATFMPTSEDTQKQAWSEICSD
jgi:hypothetical protein